jgi:prepilin-type N-terminal cleavage/methylation domain-containing protein
MVNQKVQKGFTIVELLVVIVVIAILAAITIVAYNGIQSQARDSARKSDLAAIAKAFHVYQIDNGPMWSSSGCGSGGNGNGWFNATYSGYISDMNCLKNAGVVNKDIMDPSKVANCTNGDLSCRAYMKYTCSQSGATYTYVYANLEGVGHSSTDTDGTCAVSIDTDYGMNYFVKIPG